MARYSKSAAKDVKGAMHNKKRGNLKERQRQDVKSRKQAIAIGLAEAAARARKCPRRSKSF